jgi:pyruvate dehydrogenase E2 component (dihydrolipoamide acetyltransferase)
VAEQIIMPKLGFDMAEGTLVDWRIKVGDAINKGDVVAEIETDKATIEIEATVGGTVLQFMAQPGDVVAVGAPIAMVGAPGEKVAPGAAPATQAPAAQAPAAQAPAAQAPAAEEAPAPQVEAPAPPTPAAQAIPAPAAEESAEFPGGVKASPVARRLAEEKGINLQRVKGSGPGGRITRKDVEEFPVSEAPAAPVQAPRPAAPAAPAIPPAAARPTMPTFTEIPSGPDVEVVELSRIRARIGQRLVESKQFVPHFYVTTEIDMGAALDLRQQLNASITDEAGKISVNDLIVKGVALALRQFPNLNSHYYGDKLVRHKRINIGIAVALPQGGLVNVTAYDADKTALGTLAAQNRDMVTRAREGKMKPQELEGSTFTVSNLGPYDVEEFSAIINPPEAGILAVGSAKKVPVVLEDGSLGVGIRMKATVSIDHRVSDGAEAAEFMRFLKGLLEHPMRLLI